MSGGLVACVPGVPLLLWCSMLVHESYVMNISMYVWMHLCVMKSLRMMDGNDKSVLYSSLPLAHHTQRAVPDMPIKTTKIILKWLFK